MDGLKAYAIPDLAVPKMGGRNNGFACGALRKESHTFA
jgi:hypothetical protein